MSDLTTARPEFAASIRGYDRLQVDDYVDRLHQLLGEADERTRVAESELEFSRHATIGQRVTEIFALAVEESQELRARIVSETGEMVANAERETGEILAAARDDARALIAEAESRRERVLAELEDARRDAVDEVEELQRGKTALLTELRRLQQALADATGLVSPDAEDTPTMELEAGDAPTLAAVSEDRSAAGA